MGAILESCSPQEYLQQLSCDMQTSVIYIVEPGTGANPILMCCPNSQLKEGPSSSLARDVSFYHRSSWTLDSPV